MPETSCSIRSLTCDLDLHLGPDAETDLREFDRRETDAVLRHLTGTARRAERPR